MLNYAVRGGTACRPSGASVLFYRNFHPEANVHVFTFYVNSQKSEENKKRYEEMGYKLFFLSEIVDNSSLEKMLSRILACADIK